MYQKKVNKKNEGTRIKRTFDVHLRTACLSGTEITIPQIQHSKKLKESEHP